MNIFWASQYQFESKLLRNQIYECQQYLANEHSDHKPDLKLPSHYYNLLCRVFPRRENNFSRYSKMIAFKNYTLGLTHLTMSQYNNLCTNSFYNAMNFIYNEQS